MKSLLVVRHGKPDINRNRFLKAKYFEAWWRLYDKRGISKEVLPSEKLKNFCCEFDAVMCSTSRRAKETAYYLKNKQIAIYANKEFKEADLPPPPLPFIKLPAKAWCTISRFFWWFTISGNESHLATWKRVKRAADIIEKRTQSEKQLLCAHGYFNWMLSRELKHRGWKVVHSSKDHKYWSYRYYIKE